MSRVIDITGKKYNKLKVLGLEYVINCSGIRRSYWRCKCDCGNEVVLRKDSFMYPYSKVKSCGCWHIEESKNRSKDNKSGKFIKNKEVK